MNRPSWLTRNWWAAKRAAWRSGWSEAVAGVKAAFASLAGRIRNLGVSIRDWPRWRRIRIRCRWFRRYPWNKAKSWAWSWALPPDVAEQDWFIEEDRWVLNYFPARDDESYKVTLDYAEKRYKAALDLSAELDKKLDDLVRIAATIGTIIATVVRVLGTTLVNHNPFKGSPWLIPSLLCFAVTILVAAWSRRPSKIRTPAQIRGVLVLTDKQSYMTPAGEQVWGYLSEEKIKGLLTSSYHLAEVGTNELNDWKATQLIRATIFFCLGVTLLFLMLVTSS